MGKLRIPGVVVVGAALAVGLTGCFAGFLAYKPRSGGAGRDAVARAAASFQGSFQEQITSVGVIKQEPPGQTVKGAVFKGSFKLSSVSTSALRARSSRLKLVVGEGTFVARVDGQEDFSVGVASAKGLELLKFKHAKTGSICVKIDYKTSDHGSTYTGSFKSVGGTGRSAKARASGEVTEHPGLNGQASISGTGTVRAAKHKKGLTRACKALRRL